MESFRKGKYFYAGGFISENFITGFGIKSENTEVKIGEFVNDNLNGFGFFTDVARRFIASKFVNGNLNGPSFLWVNGTMKFEEYKYSSPVNIKAFFNSVNFGMVRCNTNWGIWYTFSDSTLHIRNDEYEQKDFYVPNLVSSNEISKLLEMGQYPTCIDKDPYEKATYNSITLYGSHSCRFVEQQNGTYVLQGRSWKKKNEMSDFNIFVSSESCEYQRKNENGVPDGLCFAVSEEESQVFLAKNGTYDGPAFYFNPSKNEIFQLVIYRNNELDIVYALTKDFKMIKFDKNGNVLKEYKF